MKPSFNILFVGDIAGRPGRQALAKLLPKLKKKLKADFVAVNVENIAHGVGVTHSTIKEISDLPIDAMTSGNHIFAKRKDAVELLEEPESKLLRPANFSPRATGDGWRVFQAGEKKVLVINLISRVFMDKDHEDPFGAVDKILEEFSLPNGRALNKVDAIIVDWHSEATAEKRALGFYLDGRVSAVMGTHTHVPTGDEQVLPKGTAYISDVGMVGAKQSVLGVSKEKAINMFLTQFSNHLELSDEKEVELGAALVEVDIKTGLAKMIKRIREFVKI